MSDEVGGLLLSRIRRRAINRQGAPVTNRHLDRRDGEVDKVAIKVEESVWLVRLGQRHRCHISARFSQIAGRAGVTNGNLGLIL